MLIGLFSLLPLIFVIVGGGIIYGAWTSSENKQKTYSLSKKKSQKRFGRVGQTGFFLIFFFAGLGVGYFWFFPAAVKSFTSDNWPEVPCIVQSSRVQSHDSDDGTTYSVDIVYTYTFRGKNYRSGKYKFLGGSSSGYEGKAAVVRQYPRGKRAVCYVNPDKPSEAVLKRGLGFEALFGLIPIIFMTVGLVGAAYSIRGRSGTSARKSLRENQHNNYPPHKEQSPDKPPGSRLTLKPKTSYAGKIIGSIAVSIFWNGIVSIFLFQAVQGWRAGHPDYFLTVFLIPFVTVGIVMIGSIFYFIMASFNPRPEITLDNEIIRLGDKVDIKWATSGNVYKIQNFTLKLIGEESATYRRGTSTYTDHNLFFEKTLAESHNPESVRRGELALMIPLESMHTFKSSNNSITWKIHMHCDIPNWPDSKEDFEIVVHPMLIEDF